MSFINLKCYGQCTSDSVVVGHFANSKPLYQGRKSCLLPASVKDEQGKKESQQKGIQKIQLAQDCLDDFADLLGFSQEYNFAFEVEAMMEELAQHVVKPQPIQCSRVETTQMVKSFYEVCQAKRPFRQNTIVQSGSSFYNYSFVINNN